MRRFVVLDAMGVLYRHGNVVASLLIPYLRAHGSTATEPDIRDAYRRCTLGEISSHHLWTSLGVGATATDADYCTHHELTPGAREALDQLRSAGITPLILTNDAAPWSELLRTRFNLSAEHWYVSSQLGTRKPSPEAFAAVRSHPGLDPAQTYLVDDRPTNLAAAQAAGFRPVLFHSDDSATNQVDGFTPPTAYTMPELLTHLL
ncbi:HAD-IA family hydrolase [Kribbella sp. NPDC051770]|uniref:HAD family hydrolase n=1 Tax=Kribbella sp. NPDC051770 TaxID=3155413 RepID=UPI003438E006